MNEGDSRRAVEKIDIAGTEKVEFTAFVLSAPPGEKDTVLDHPLREQMNKNDRNEAEVISSMLRHGLRLISIESFNDRNFVKICQNFPNFGSLGKIGNLNFPVT